MLLPKRKQCTKCGRKLPATTEFFYKDKRGKYGLRANCKQCQNDRIKKYKKKYRENNRDKEKKYKKKYYENNRDKEKERVKQWYKNNPHIEFNKNNKRRQREENQGNGITKEQWLEIMEFFDWKCAYSGIQLNKEHRTIDHIVPLNKGGLNEIWNCVPMYKPYNSSKKDKDMLEWYKQQEFYSEERLAKIYEWCEYAYNKWGKEAI